MYANKAYPGMCKASPSLKKLVRNACFLVVLLALCGAPGRSEELPEDLRARLVQLGASDAGARERLAEAALLVLEAGWTADSLSLRGESLRVHGARRERLRLELRGAEEPALWHSDPSPSSPNGLRREALAWLEAMDRRGHPFAQVWFKARREEEALVYVVNLSEGPSGLLGELRLSGAKRLEEPFLREMTGIDAERPLSRAAARRGRDRLLATGWFLSVAEPELGWDPVGKRVGLLYRVRELPRPNRITALVGGGSGTTSGAVDLDLFSPFGHGRRWRLRGDWLGQQRSQVDLAFDEPRILGRSLGMELAFHRSKQDSTYLQLAVELDLRLPLPAGWEGIAGIGYERSLFGLGGGEEDDAEMSRRRHRFGLAWRTLGGDPFLSRSCRLLSDLLIRRSQLAGEEPELRQLALNGEGRWTWRLSRPWKLRLGGGGQMLWSPENRFNQAELYAIGGARTLRGYDEEHFRGDAVTHLSAELALGEPLELAVFLDYGWGRWRRAGAPETRFEGWGAGLGLLAPGERGRLSLALALGESKRLADLRVHLALDTGF